MERSAATARLDTFVEHPKRAVWTMAAPMMAGFVVHALYSVVDTAFIGRLGPAALAAATFVVGPFFVAFSIANGLAVGITATVAQAVGRRDLASAARVASGGLGLALVLGLLLATTGLLLGAPALRLLGAEGEVAQLAWQYFHWIAWAMPLFLAAAALRAVLAGQGDARTPMAVVALSTLLNLGLDPLLIFGFELGIAGASLATLLAQLVSLSVLVVLALRVRGQLRLQAKALWPDRESLVAIARIGLPATAGQLVMAVGMGMSAHVISSFGQLAVAGFGAGGKVDMLVALPILGLASATVSVVGMFAGAGRADLVRLVTLHTYRSVVVLAVIFGGGAYLAAGTVIGLFTKDPQALAVGREYLAYMVFSYPLMAFGMTSGRILQGLGHGLPSLVITLVRVPLVGVGGSYLAVYLFGAPLRAVWLSFIVGGATANILAALWVYRAVWRSDPTARAQASRKAGGDEAESPSEPARRAS